MLSRLTVKSGSVRRDARRESDRLPLSGGGRRKARRVRGDSPRIPPRISPAETLGLADTVRSIPIVDPAVTYSIGMVLSQRDPMTPLIAALVNVAREVAPKLQSA